MDWRINYIERGPIGSNVQSLKKTGILSLLTMRSMNSRVAVLLDKSFPLMVVCGSQ